MAAIGSFQQRRCVRVGRPPDDVDGGEEKGDEDGSQRAHHQHAEETCSGDPISALTPRQREVLQLLAEGRPTKEVGSGLAISARTVEFSKYQMMETLGVHTNAELIHLALKHGLVEL